MARMPRGHRAGGTVRFAASCLAVATGCTMCPDPLDYSGPVPNGSAPQNDFRARSNGILPIGGVVQPWPQIVAREAIPAQAGIPTLADDTDALPGPVVVDAPVMSVLVDHEPRIDAIVGDASAPAPSVEDAPAPASVSVADEDADIVAMLLPPHEQPAPTTPPARESPGWKRRR